MSELFKDPPPKLKRTSKARKQEMIDRFIQTGSHYSPSGLTATLIVEYCIANGITFTASYNAEFKSLAITRHDL